MVSSRLLLAETRNLLSDKINIHEAEIIIEECSGLSYSDILIDKSVSESDAFKIRNMTERRISGEPLQYIIGHWPFRNLDLFIGPGVLIPRPETELIIDIAKEILKEKDSSLFIDLCCGSGNIAISLNKETGCHGIAVDISPEALKYCRFNSAKYNADIEIVEADIFDYSSYLHDGAFDLIISNPPYVSPNDYQSNYDELSKEPLIAFVPPDGNELSFYIRILEHYFDLLDSCGAFVLECGYNQANSILNIAEAYNFKSMKTVKDLSGIERFVVLSK